MIIGLTGGIGTGKSTVSAKMAERGYPIINLDMISRKVIKMPEIVNEIVRNFGKEILEEPDAPIDRRSISRDRLRQTVFKDEKKVNVLNSIMHPPIIEEMKREIREARKKHETVIVEVQLLFEVNLEREFDIIVLVYADRQTQIKRVTGRDNRTVEEVQEIINSQMDIEEKRKRSNYIIENNGNIENLEKEINKFIESLKI